MKFIFAIFVMFGTGAFAETEAARQAELDDLFAILQEDEDWEEAEDKIVSTFEHSGSAAMDLLLERGADAMNSANFPKAVEHLSALIDHAPDFAEAYNARATAYYLMDEYGLSLADIRETLILNPRHFGALAGLGFIYEDLGELDGALAAYSAAQAINPHMESVNDGIVRVEAKLGAADI